MTREIPMNKRQRKRAKKLKERRERENTEYNPTLTLHEPLTPKQYQIAKTSKTKSDGQPIWLKIIFGSVPAILALIGLYWAISVPDIRYIPVVEPETMTTVENTVDSAGNFIHNVKLRVMFTNYAFKPGFIDKVDFVPESIVTCRTSKSRALIRLSSGGIRKRQ